MAKQSVEAADFIVPLNINGLEGRMLRMPATNDRKREILLLYGHHALIERWWGLVENLHDYGNVTMPDLPGFGGMDSFHKIHKRPDLDTFADYLAAFIKLRFRRKRITIVGISFGFIVATRMLERYPELAKRVDLLVSIVGFMHKDDFLFSRPRRAIYRRGTRVFATRPLALFIRYVALNPIVLRNFYTKLPAARKRFLEVDPLVFNEMMKFEVKLWQSNDVRTHWLTTSEFLNLDNCVGKIDIPVWHVASKGDHWFNNFNVEQHMRIVFDDYHQLIANSKAHTPSVLADKKGLGVLLPVRLRRELSKPVN
jgi:pimeloyl-ACP methyl ester carboxylesterase